MGEAAVNGHETTNGQRAATSDDASIDWDEKRKEWAEEAKVRSALQAKALEANKMALFDALAAVSVTEVLVEFDGEGDSGQIDHVQASNANGTVTLPDARIEVASAPWGRNEPNRTDATLGEAIETVCYALLSANCGGWEINEGSYGLFVFDVAERTIELTHNERCVSVETSEHTF